MRGGASHIGTRALASEEIMIVMMIEIIVVIIWITMIIVIVTMNEQKIFLSARFSSYFSETNNFHSEHLSFPSAQNCPPFSSVLQPILMTINKIGAEAKY